jgi:DNA-binding NarL/FixJ family response regulator
MSRRALGDVLTESEAFCVVGEAGSGEEAIALVSQLRPSMVVMDLSMPDGVNGAEATRRIRQLSDAPVVVVASTWRRGEIPFDIEDCGAAGYVPKDELRASSLKGIWDRARQVS